MPDQSGQRAPPMTDDAQKEGLIAEIQASLADLIGREITDELRAEITKRLKARAAIIDELAEHEEEDF
jgi:hypothetical protein